MDHDITTAQEIAWEENEAKYLSLSIVSIPSITLNVNLVFLVHLQLP